MTAGFERQHILRVDPGFFKGGRMWLVPCAVESKGHATKILQFENWNLIENCCTRNTSNATTFLAKKRFICNCNELPVTESNTHIDSVTPFRSDFIMSAVTQHHQYSTLCTTSRAVSTALRVISLVCLWSAWPGLLAVSFTPFCLQLAFICILLVLCLFLVLGII